MHSLSLNIVRFVDDSQPGWVACEFTDADGVLHTLIDKIPIFTSDDIWTDSTYPHPGVAECEVLDSFQDQAGRELVRIDLIESTEGVSEFVVLKSQVANSD